MKASLVLARGRQEGRVIPVQPSPFLIGRHMECHLRPASPKVGEHHCAVWVEEDRLVIRDLNSRIGTLVNGQPITGDVELQAGDQLQVGPLAFVIWLGSDVCSEETIGADSRPAAAQAEQGDDEDAAAAILLAAEAEIVPEMEYTDEEAPLPPSSKPLTETASDRDRLLAEAERCDFANYAEPRRKLISGDASLTAMNILKQYLVARAAKAKKDR